MTFYVIHDGIDFPECLRSAELRTDSLALAVRLADKLQKETEQRRYRVVDVALMYSAMMESEKEIQRAEPKPLPRPP